MRAQTFDLAKGLGLVRWGDGRPEVSEAYPEASYDTHTNVYAMQRTFGIEGFFGSEQGLAGVWGYVDPSVPEIILDAIRLEAARALLDRLGCPLSLDAEEERWESAGVTVTVCAGPGRDAAWIHVEGPASASVIDEEDGFGPYNEVDD